jgi:DNA-binding SARP family transcriptional activator
MTDVLQLRLLGYPELRLGDAPLRFRRRKTLALLVYLVLTGRPAARETLAALLSDPDKTSEQLALQSLRASVSELRDQLADYLVVSRQAVAFEPAAPHRVDVHEFQHLLTPADVGVPARLARAAELYAGDLLAGFTLRGAPGYEAWLAAERQRLRDLAAQAWHQRLESAAAAGDLAAGLAAAERLLAICPTAEATYRRVMALLAARGEREQALQFYERCRTALAEQLGVTPAPETIALYARISAEGARAAAPPRVRRAGIAPPDDELALLVERLAAPECRLVTLLAATPEAATALAMRAVTRFLMADHMPPPFPDGIYVIAAAAGSQSPTPSTHSLAEMIRHVLAAGSSEHPASADALLEHLASAGMLLVLDGLMPTENELALVVAILRRAPWVTLLVAARERLYLQEEWVLDVGEVQQVGASD